MYKVTDQSGQVNDAMDKAIRFTQAYPQAPWRKQLQGIGLFLTVVLVFVLLGSIFVSITARTATLGREIQRYHQEMESLELEIAQMRSDLAEITSTDVMEQRALEMGFRPVRAEEIRYIRVPGYTGKPDVAIAAPAQTVVAAAPVLSPAFTQSWVDWLAQQFRTPVLPLADLEP